ncbi:hypothetical protein [uncultured Sphingomonas sp.]|uniref:hypothetical protein n=1 Tax=uncultured Sphingomonas sp. TaxID=158754 RepID=UPI0035CA77F5
MRKTGLVALGVIALASSGCVRTVMGVVTAPVRVAGKAVDWTTTSQSEADRNYGRKMRKQEAREGGDRRKAAKQCRKDPSACGPYDGYRAGAEN